MRLCTSLSLCLAAAAATVVVPGSPGAAQADAGPSCAGADAGTFPLAGRIRGGPASYEAGGGYGTWYVDLTNTTRRSCAGIHPVVVLVDDARALRPGQPRMDFYEGSRVRPVTFEATDAQELVGVLDGAGFAGFTVPPGRTVSVCVRLSFTSEAVPGRVTANAAVVQRRGEDGDWVGASGAYRFQVTRDGDGPPQRTGDPRRTPDPPDTRDPRGTDTPQDAEGTQDPDTESTRDPDTAGTQDPQGAEPTPNSLDAAAVPPVPTSAAPSLPAGTDATDPSPGSSPHSPHSDFPLAREARDAGERPHELARTGGLGLAQGLLAAVTALIALGTTAYLRSRARR
ncbi:hypothetical protein ACH4PW_21915 [Streptomyces sp. NPDC017082]|uniref:hypothetical protein n=1 Tax=Streptomyces sp. NPDC017082 TaxID=3364974 RepID=UPI0037A54E66